MCKNNHHSIVTHTTSPILIQICDNNPHNDVTYRISTLNLLYHNLGRKVCARLMSNRNILRTRNIFSKECARLTSCLPL